TQPRWSPDGRHLAFLCDKGGYLNLWLADSDGANPRPLVSEDAEHGTPPWTSGARTYDWAPDSRSIVYGRNQDTSWSLYLVEMPSGRPRPRGAPAGVYSGLRWSPDGRQVLALYSNSTTPTQVVTCDARTGTPSVLADSAVGGIDDQTVDPTTLTWQAPDGLEIPG